MQQQKQLSWKDRRKQKRKSIFGSAAFVTMIAVILTIILIIIGVLSPVVGSAIIGSGALLVAFLTWQFPRPSPPPPQSASQLPS